ncbi:MAG TPA: hypothetical protein VLM40_15515, partial [Gemmata sp.]|nr:hypothetical protein [Gemmata sp.]
DEAALPALRSLTIPSGQYLAGVADHPGWSRIESIGLVGIDDPRDRDSRNHAPAWRAVFRSPHIRPTGFTVGSPGYYDLAATGFWDELTAAAWFGNLKELSISLYDEICTPLFDRPVENFPRLKSLTLSPNAELVERLAEWPGLAHLVELGVDHGFGDRQPADPEATVKLFQSQHLTPRLGRLRASGICKSPATVSALADCAALRGLEHLDFGFNELSEAGAAELAASPHLCHLKSLHTWSEWTESGKPAWLILADPRKFPQLRDVVVGSGTPEEAVDELRRRFGPRLRVFADC